MFQPQQGDMMIGLSPEQHVELEKVREAAKIRHEKNCKAASGRVDFPMLPYECSWAYEMEFMRKCK